MEKQKEKGMNIIDKLNTQVAQKHTSARAVARACGVTVAEMDEDMRKPDPKDDQEKEHDEN